MKNYKLSCHIIVGVIFIFTSFSYSQESQNLKQVMKEMNIHLKLILKTVADTQKNIENTKNCDPIIELLRSTMILKPDFILTLPAEHQAQSFIEYQRMIQQAIDLIQDLRQAFVNNDNLNAEKKIREILDLKKDGHDKFDP